MASIALNLEQIQFIAATMGPHLGPKIDDAARNGRFERREEVLSAASWAVATDETLHAAIVGEIYPDTSVDTDHLLIAVRALGVIAATVAVHDQGTLMDVIARELMPHSAALRGDMARG